MQTAVSALRVLDQVAHSQPVGVTDLARSTGMPKSTTQRALLALEEAGWIRRAGTSRQGWVLTTKPIDMARHVTADTGLREAARDHMMRLRDQTGESVHLAIREESIAVIIDVEDTVDPVRIYWPPGVRSAIHATANGKALVAWMPPDEVRRVCGTNLTRFTDTTCTDIDELLDELATVREQGWAKAWGELRPDIASVAAPVMDRLGFPLASMSVFAPVHRMPDPTSLGPQVRATADAVAETLTHARRPASTT